MAAEDRRSPDAQAGSATLRQRIGALRERAGRATAWALEHRIKTGMLACAMLVSAGSAVVLWMTLIRYGDQATLPFTLDDALAALDNGRYMEATDMAKALRQYKTMPADELGGPMFVLGAAKAYEARDMGPREGRRRFLIAARYLEDARDRGFPTGHKAEGLLLLGESLLGSDQLPASRSALKEALEVDRSRKSEIFDLLAVACLEDTKPLLTEALDYNTRYLDDRLLPKADRDRALVRQARILLGMEKKDQCRATLREISADSRSHAAAVIVEGQLLMHEAAELAAGGKNSQGAMEKEAPLYEQAIKVLRTAKSRDTLSTQATRKAEYLIGICFSRMGEYRAALNQFKRIHAIYARSPEAIAATLQEADIARQTGRDTAALAEYRRVLRSVTTTQPLRNPWFSLDELREKMQQAYEAYLKAGKFSTALELVQNLDGLFPKEKTTLWTAQTLDEWGLTLLMQADDAPHDKAEPMRRQGRKQLRRAGRAWEELAALETVSRSYTDHLWQSAQDYLAGHAYADAARVLREYLKNETRHRRPRALVELGEALLSLDEVDDALVALGDCTDFHARDAAAFRARLLASRAYMEKGDTSKAQNLLEENLNGVLSPTSTEWRESLFALGDLLFSQGEYEKATARLTEAIERYPNLPESIEARYLIANCYRQQVEASRKKLASTQIPYIRMNEARKIDGLLRTALDHYRGVREALGSQQHSGNLNSQQTALLRNTWFAVGRVEFELGMYAESVDTYTTATFRYQSSPAVLLAYLQMAYAHERLGQAAAARNTLRQAKLALKRIGDDAPFLEVTPYDRQQWEQLFDAKIVALADST